MPVPQFDAEGDTNAGVSVEKGKTDPFAPPYIPNLLVGEFKDEVEDDEYAVLVRVLYFAILSDFGRQI